MASIIILSLESVFDRANTIKNENKELPEKIKILERLQTCMLDSRWLESSQVTVETFNSKDN